MPASPTNLGFHRLTAIGIAVVPSAGPCLPERCPHAYGIAPDPHPQGSPAEHCHTCCDQALLFELLNLAAHSPEDSEASTTENSVLRVSNGPDRKDCSVQNGGSACDYQPGLALFAARELFQRASGLPVCLCIGAPAWTSASAASRAPRWPQALRRSPVPAATSLGQEPVLSAAPSRASRSKWRRLARPSSARPVARPARLAVRPHESIGMLIGRHRRYTGYGARGGPPDDPISRHHRVPPRTMVMVRAIEPACAIGRPWSSDTVSPGES